MKIATIPNESSSRISPHPDLTIAMLVFVLCSCGGSSSTPQLVALAVQPTNAEAVAPGVTGPFTAIGTFNQPPTAESNLAAQWVSSDPAVATGDSNSGIATCVAMGGPITIAASAPGLGGTLTGSATLTCFSQPSGVGHCEVAPDGKLNGDCIGERGGICHAAYDPANCPIGQAPVDPGPD